MVKHFIFKNNLKYYRDKAGLTQIQLADLIGTSKNTISALETGLFCPNAYTAMLLCVVLGCKFEQLFYFEFEL